MEFVTLNSKNIDDEHICCAISDKKGECCVSSKKAWLKQRFSDGLVFTKLNERGKVFIEYLPAENSWCPIIAPNYMYINCFWVSGSFKGKGYANKLLNSCIHDAMQKGKDGLVVLSSKKKMPFLSDPQYLKHKGFLVCDISLPHFELLYLPFSEKSLLPKFKECAKQGTTDEKGFVLYYSHQCPHTAKYAPLIKTVAEQKGVDLKLVLFDDKTEAQNAPSPFTTYSLFYNGKFITNEILSEAKFIKLIEEKHG